MTIQFLSSKIVFAIFNKFYYRDVAQFGTVTAVIVQTATEYSEALGGLQSAGAHLYVLKLYSIKYYNYYRDVAQFGRALRSGRRGRVFESRHPDQKEKPLD